MQCAFILRVGKIDSRYKIMSIRSTFFTDDFIFIFVSVATPAENLKLNKTFVQWMEEHANFRTICEEGKGK